MATYIHAFVEYDDTNGASPGADVPFQKEVDSSRVIDLTRYDAFLAGKDYRFFSAIAGVQRETWAMPRYPPRGLPENVSTIVKDYMMEYIGSGDGCVIGWLTYMEMLEALSSSYVEVADLSLAPRVVLAMMAFLGSQLGTDRVRLVFAFE